MTYSRSQCRFLYTTATSDEFEHAIVSGRDIGEVNAGQPPPPPRMCAAASGSTTYGVCLAH